MPGNTIGGSSSGAGNVISANYWGLVITGSSATDESFQGNFIGTGCHRQASRWATRRTVCSLPTSDRRNN